MSDGHAACSQAPVSESPLRIVAAVSGPATRVRRDAGICRWSSNLSYAIRHFEGERGTLGGKDQGAKVAKFQFRPDPLAKQERGRAARPRSCRVRSPLRVPDPLSHAIGRLPPQ